MADTGCTLLASVRRIAIIGVIKHPADRADGIAEVATHVSVGTNAEIAAHTAGAELLAGWTATPEAVRRPGRLAGRLVANLTRVVWIDRAVGVLASVDRATLGLARSAAADALSGTALAGIAADAITASSIPGLTASHGVGWRPCRSAVAVLAGVRRVDRAVGDQDSVDGARRRTVRVEPWRPDVWVVLIARLAGKVAAVWIDLAIVVMDAVDRAAGFAAPADSGAASLVEVGAADVAFRYKRPGGVVLSRAAELAVVGRVLRALLVLHRVDRANAPPAGSIRQAALALLTARTSAAVAVDRIERPAADRVVGSRSPGLGAIRQTAVLAGIVRIDCLILELLVAYLTPAGLADPRFSAAVSDSTALAHATNLAARFTTRRLFGHRRPGEWIESRVALLALISGIPGELRKGLPLDRALARLARPVLAAIPFRTAADVATNLRSSLSTGGVIGQRRPI